MTYFFITLHIHSAFPDHSPLSVLRVSLCCPIQHCQSYYGFIDLPLQLLISQRTTSKCTEATHCPVESARLHVYIVLRDKPQAGTIATNLIFMILRLHRRPVFLLDPPTTQRQYKHYHKDNTNIIT